MKKATKFLTAALILNIIILIPVISRLLFGDPSQSWPLGPETNGRLILTAIYTAIAIVSAGLVFMHVKRMTWAFP